MLKRAFVRAKYECDMLLITCISHLKKLKSSFNLDKSHANRQDIELLIKTREN